MKLRIREYCDRMFDFLSFWLVSIVSGINISAPKSYQKKDTGNRRDKKHSSFRIFRDDKPNESSGSYTGSGQRIWANESYFIGSLQFYTDLGNAMREKGLEYTVRYYKSSRDRNA